MSFRADRVFGLAWALLGAAIVVESWRMDRLEQQHINPVTAPGLVPGLLGVVLVAFGIVLAARRAPPVEMPVEQDLLGLDEPPPEAPHGASEPWRVGLALLLCLGFAGGLVGSGLPFWAAAFVFLLLAIVLFEWPERRAAGTIARGAAQAALIAGCAAAFITLVFQEVFLVRLP
ncbi:hypothetical protein GXW74_12275 [Roseomonas eburnea]|uniref:DUF1468 domain-containing protein n=1 Tax=Neoroseomonas eburnea TaxID=1346889 RepID=A0A9X9XC27_9PROT|nr:tripartite tricarboxylate transporter TctB family protein [Neoroseomonas eburnea]MBR0681263.1 hypothetical protein [Neoroseomonas eburnea]